MTPNLVEMVATGLFAAAVVHTFAAPLFMRLAQTQPARARIWHLLGEVEVAFGLWSVLLMVAMVGLIGVAPSVAYLESRDFTEPMFVFVVLVVAGTRPLLRLSSQAVQRLCRSLPLSPGRAGFAVVLSVVPLLGSLITEPAAMTLAALLLRDPYFGAERSARLKYATLGVLFVNISIGGTLTPFAAPPVLMVAGTWGWDFAFMLSTFGWKAALLVSINALAVTWWFRRELAGLSGLHDAVGAPVPLGVTLAHLVFLAAVVLFAHHAVVFVGVLLLFLAFVSVTEPHQDRLMLRQALLVACFLAGLVLLGGPQRWWLEPSLRSLNTDTVYWGAIALTAITDNAALTFLASLVEDLSPEFKVALVAGAVTGGGLTVIANAPNPAGIAILGQRFEGGSVQPLGLLLAALPPTLVAAIGFRLL